MERRQNDDNYEIIFAVSHTHQKAIPILKLLRNWSGNRVFVPQNETVKSLSNFRQRLGDSKMSTRTTSVHF